MATHFFCPFRPLPCHTKNVIVAFKVLFPKEALHETDKNVRRRTNPLEMSLMYSRQ